MQAKKMIKNRSGFTLTEVMVGIMILTIAVVAATNLLVGLIASNKDNMKTVQAYYLAQEGIEAVRNIRDSNWLHNTNWLGQTDGHPWGGNMMVDEVFDVQLRKDGWTQGPESVSVASLGQLASVVPWKIIPGDGKIHDTGNTDTGFKRQISIKSYPDENGTAIEDHVLVESKVSWEDGEREVVLSEVITDWKGGAL